MNTAVVKRSLIKCTRQPILHLRIIRIKFKKKNNFLSFLPNSTKIKKQSIINKYVLFIFFFLNFVYFEKLQISILRFNTYENWQDIKNYRKWISFYLKFFNSIKTVNKFTRCLQLLIFFTVHLYLGEEGLSNFIWDNKFSEIEREWNFRMKKCRYSNVKSCNKKTLLKNNRNWLYRDPT